MRLRERVVRADRGQHVGRHDANGGLGHGSLRDPGPGEKYAMGSPAWLSTMIYSMCFTETS